MVKYDVQISSRAKADLRSIKKYLRENASDFTAEKVANGILDETEKLRKMPTGNSLFPEISSEKRTYRYTKKWKYKIIFYINEEEETVNIVKIHHSSRNPDALIEEAKGWE